MTEDLIAPLAVLTVACQLAALHAWFRRHYASAHALNLIPAALISALSLLAVVTHTAGQVTASGLAALAALLALALLDVMAVLRSARWRALFWLTALMNLGLIAGLVYLRFYFKIL